jgi:hypothetical protein
MTSKRRRLTAPAYDGVNRSDLLVEPDLDAMPIDEAVAYFVEIYGMSESRARFMIMVDRGLIEGCCIEVADTDADGKIA